jgi:hypothetical protein
MKLQKCYTCEDVFDYDCIGFVGYRDSYLLIRAVYVYRIYRSRGLGKPRARRPQRPYCYYNSKFTFEEQTRCNQCPLNTKCEVLRLTRSIKG